MYKLGVIQLIDSLNVGGSEVLAVNIANDLLEQGVNSHLCVTRKEGVLFDNLKNKNRYIFVNKTKIIDLKALFSLRRYIKRNEIHIIHAHGSSSFFAICLKFLVPKIKVIWHNHYGYNINLKGFRLIILKLTSFFFSTIINRNYFFKLIALI